MELSTEMAFSWSLIQTKGIRKEMPKFFFSLFFLFLFYFLTLQYCSGQQQAQPNLEGARKVLKTLL